LQYPEAVYLKITFNNICATDLSRLIFVTAGWSFITVIYLLFFLLFSMILQSLRVKRGFSSTHPSLEHIKYLLLCDWLVGGLRIGLGSRGKDGVNVNIN